MELARTCYCLGIYSWYIKAQMPSTFLSPGRSWQHCAQDRAPSLAWPDPQTLLPSASPLLSASALRVCLPRQGTVLISWYQGPDREGLQRQPPTEAAGEGDPQFHLLSSPVSSPAKAPLEPLEPLAPVHAFNPVVVEKAWIESHQNKGAARFLLLAIQDCSLPGPGLSPALCYGGTTPGYARKHHPDSQDA